jgi:hypothetical protein
MSNFTPPSKLALFPTWENDKKSIAAGLITKLALWLTGRRHSRYWARRLADATH